jgi:hypothetical protein
MSIILRDCNIWISANPHQIVALIIKLKDFFMIKVIDDIFDERETEILQISYILVKQTVCQKFSPYKTIFELEFEWIASMDWVQ